MTASHRSSAPFLTTARLPAREERHVRPARGRGPRSARRLIGIALGIALLGGCGARDGVGGGGGGDSLDGAECSIEHRRRWVEEGMRDYYLFADRVPPIRLEEYASDEAVLAALRVEPPDRYSYLSDEGRYDALFEEGVTFGFGWHFVRTDPDTLRFSRLTPGSPAARAGIVRGERLLTINGLSLSDFYALSAAESDRLLGLPDTPTTLTLGVETLAGERREVTLRSERFPLVTVEKVGVAEHAGTRVGYLRFASFLETSRAELDEAFATLAAGNVRELVLDLRYNGGGRVDVAADLAGGIGGGTLAGKTFAHFRYNASYAAFDREFPFGQRFAALDLSRVFVLTTAGTCSSSELVINSLAPFMEVVTIGRTTCGKPFGTAPDRDCGRVLNALSMRFENAVGVGDYSDGLAPDCPLDEDVRTAMGSAGDPLYDLALDIVENGTTASGNCGLLASRTTSRSGRAPYPDGLPGGTDPLLENAILP